MSSEKSRAYLNQTWYVVLFIFLLSLFAGAVLSTTYYLLAPLQETAATFDRNKQMLTAAHLLNEEGRFQIYEDMSWHDAVYDKKTHLLKISQKSPVITSSILDMYVQDFVRPLLTNREGKLFSFSEMGINLKEFLEKHQGNFYQQPLLLFYVVLENTERARQMTDVQIIRDPNVIQSLIIPISGFGLWGPIHGYLGIQNDGNHVLGTTWYQQGETPGLGANISNPLWQKQFYQKEVFLNSAPEPTDFTTAPLGLEVIKGSVATVYGSSPKAHSYIDGISGATLTCNGVTEAYTQSLAPYRQLLLFFSNLNNQRDHNGNT